MQTWRSQFRVGHADLPLLYKTHDQVLKGGVRAIVQCKAHAKKISPAVVRELYGTLMAHPASLAILASTQGPSDNARLWAEGKPVRFIGIDDLVEGRLG